MGLFKFLKEKFSKKNENRNNQELEKNSNEILTNSQNNKEKESINDLKKYEDGLEKSRKSFADKLKVLSKKYKKVNQEYFDNLEEILIEADVGVKFTLEVIQELLIISKDNKINDSEKINELLIDLLFEKYTKDTKNNDLEIKFDNKNPTICLIVGVNGVGKTTSIAKLAYRYKNQNKKVLILACDTFRAAAIEQLTIWAERINVDIISGNQNQDPSSILYKGLEKAKNEKYDLVIVDTAGRLQNKINLMNELNKMNKVIEKLSNESIKENLLILDATTGQNGVNQARSFFDSVGLSGIIITKMDGTSKGGIILSIKQELNIPVRFIGLGEKLDDLELFDLEKYLYSLCIPKDEK